MRRALGVLVATTTALSLVAVAQAAPRAERSSARAPALPAQAAAERAFAYFAPAHARPSSRQAAKADPRGATMALRDLAAVFERLTGADRRLAAAILARPTDSGGGNYSAPRANFRKSCDQPDFCVHWVTSTHDAPALTDADVNGQPDWIDEVEAVMTEVWAAEITNLGYKEPKADRPTGGHRGGNPNTKLDIFIQNVGRQGLYGYCTTDDPKRGDRRDVSAYCVLDDDYAAGQFPGTNGVDALKVTAAHEFHHATQFAYDWKEDRALMEGTATNIEGTVYPAIHDNYQYFSASPLNPVNGAQDGPWWPVDMFDAEFGNHYGSWIWYRFLEEYVGAVVPDPSINREIWQQAAAVPGTNQGGKYSTQAMRGAIAGRGETFDAAFAEFGWANASPDDWYINGGDYPTAGYWNRTAELLNDGTDAQSWPAFHFSNDYVRFAPSASTNTITFNLNFPDLERGSSATVLQKNANGTVVAHDVTLSASGNTTTPVVVPFDDAVVSSVVLVITNDSTRMRNCGSHSFGEPVTFACRGDARDDFLNGGFNYTATAG